MRTVLIVFVIGLAGCASRIETVRLDAATFEQVGKGISGVVYYDAKLVKLRYEFTQLLDSKKVLVGTAADGTCQQVIEKEEIVTLPDYQHPRALLYQPSWFSTNEFGVTLDNGMLVAVTSKSTPQTPQLLAQVISAKDAGVFVTAGQACNAGPVITARDVVRF